MRTAAAFLIAVCAAVALGIALAFACGGMSALPAAFALLGGAVAGGFAFRQMPRAEKTGRPIHPVEWALIAIYAMACLRAFLWLLYTSNDEYHILSPNNLGDLPLHMDFIRYLASGVHFWPDSPIFSGEPLKYPIGADFFNSLLLDAGVPLEQGLVWTALAGSLATGLALWRWGRGFAMAAFLFGGGLSAFVMFREPGLIGHIRFHDYQADATWKNLFLALFVTQRGLLIALPAGLLLLDHWRARYLRGERGLLPGWAALFLYATLPLYNVHAFLYLSVALAGMFVFASDSAARRQSLIFVGMAFLPAALCVALTTGGFSAGGGVHWEPGWMQRSEEGIGPAWFWLRNFGLYLVLWAGLAIAAIIHGPRETRAIVFPATLMFLACCFVSFAPWAWDNTKILLWCWLAVAPCIWNDLLKPIHVALRSVVCFVLFFTGGVSLIAGLDGRHDYTILDRSLVRGAESAVRGINPEARFACSPEYWHPLIILGRKIAMGYAGHLVSHGITYRGKNQDKVLAFEDLMLGGPGWMDRARKLGVNYIYWGRAEEERYPGSLKPWEKTLPIAGKGEEFVIYALPPG
jgi:hypothetical protein